MDAKQDESFISIPKAGRMLGVSTYTMKGIIRKHHLSTIRPSVHCRVSLLDVVRYRESRSKKQVRRRWKATEWIL